MAETVTVPLHLTPARARALSRLGHRILDAVLTAGAERGDARAALDSAEGGALLALIGGIAHAGHGLGEQG